MRLGKTKKDFFCKKSFSGLVAQPFCSRGYLGSLFHIFFPMQAVHTHIPLASTRIPTHVFSWMCSTVWLSKRKQTHERGGLQLLSNLRFTCDLWNRDVKTFRDDNFGLTQTRLGSVNHFVGTPGFHWHRTPTDTHVFKVKSPFSHYLLKTLLWLNEGCDLEWAAQWIKQLSWTFDVPSLVIMTPMCTS